MSTASHVRWGRAKMSDRRQGSLIQHGDGRRQTLPVSTPTPAESTGGSTGLTMRQRAALDAHRAPPWRPGQSGNPAGRKRGTPNGPRATLRRLLRTRAPAEAIEMVKARFPDMDLSTLADVLAATHIRDALFAPDARDRNAARRSLL